MFFITRNPVGSNRFSRRFRNNDNKLNLEDDEEEATYNDRHILVHCGNPQRSATSSQFGRPKYRKPSMWVKDFRGVMYYQFMPHHKFTVTWVWIYLRQDVFLPTLLNWHWPLQDPMVRKFSPGKFVARNQMLFSENLGSGMVLSMVFKPKQKKFDGESESSLPELRKWPFSEYERLRSEVEELRNRDYDMGLDPEESYYNSLLERASTGLSEESFSLMERFFTQNFCVKSERCGPGKEVTPVRLGDPRRLNRVEFMRGTGLCKVWTTDPCVVLHGSGQPLRGRTVTSGKKLNPPPPLYEAVFPENDAVIFDRWGLVTEEDDSNDITPLHGEWAPGAFGCGTMGYVPRRRYVELEIPELELCPEESEIVIEDDGPRDDGNGEISRELMTELELRFRKLEKNDIKLSSSIIRSSSIGSSSQDNLNYLNCSEDSFSKDDDAAFETAETVTALTEESMALSPTDPRVLDHFLVKNISNRVQGLQIRIGSARGVVIVNENLAGRKLVLRKGMVKWFQNACEVSAFLGTDGSAVDETPLAELRKLDLDLGNNINYSADDSDCVVDVEKFLQLEEELLQLEENFLREGYVTSSSTSNIKKDSDIDEKTLKKKPEKKKPERKNHRNLQNCSSTNAKNLTKHNHLKPFQYLYNTSDRLFPVRRTLAGHGSRTVRFRHWDRWQRELEVSEIYDQKPKRMGKLNAQTALVMAHHLGDDPATKVSGLLDCSLLCIFTLFSLEMVFFHFSLWTLFSLMKVALWSFEKAVCRSLRDGHFFYAFFNYQPRYFSSSRPST